MSINVEKELWNKQAIVSMQHSHISVGDLPVIIGTSFMKLAAYIEANSGKIIDAPFVAYHGINDENTMDEANMKIEIGFPIAELITENDEIKCYIREPFEVITTMYQGDSADIDKAYLAIRQWAKENGYKTENISYEHYLSDETVPVDKQLTKASIPIIK